MRCAEYSRPHGCDGLEYLHGLAELVERGAVVRVDEDRTRAALEDLVTPRRRRQLLTIRGAERGFAVDASHAFKSDNFD